MIEIDRSFRKNGETLIPYFDSRLQIRPSPIHGHGIFAIERISSGELVIAWSGCLYTIEEARAGVPKPDSLAGFDEGLYLGEDPAYPDTLDRFLNHSCDPVLWMANQHSLCARCDIFPGDEVTADYALWEIDPAWNFGSICRCGSANCRRNITGNDWELRELQERYAGHFLPCINRRINSRSRGG
jgi:hypothetical protein